MKASISLGGMIISMTIAQIFLKYAGIHTRTVNMDWFEAYFYNPWLWAGLIVSAIGLLLWLLTLRRLPLAIAYPWTSLIYILTPIASVIFFNDTFNIKYATGIIFITIGIFYTTHGVKT